MSPFSRKPILMLGISILLLALTSVGAGGATQGRETDLASPVSLRNNSASVGTAFTYQGKLTDGSSPADGEYDFRFILFDASVGGSQVGPIETEGNLLVVDGVFTAALDFGGVFTGTALWLEIGVRDGTSGGAYTLLSPRQPLTATPYALGLLPGAVLDNPTGHGLVIANANTNGLRIENASTGVRILTATNDGIRIESAANNGFQIDDAGLDGLYVGTAGNNGIQIDHADERGLDIDSAEKDGIRIDTTGWDGLRVVSASDDGVNVEFAGNNGIEVDNAGNNGIQIDHADGNGIFICATGTETSCPLSDLNNGIEIGTAEAVGVYVQSAGFSGLYVESTGLSGLTVQSAGSDGVRVNSAGDDGVDVAGDDLAGFFAGNIQVTGSCTGCLLATFGINTGSETLQPGDLVTVLGTQIIENDSTPMLMEVAPAKSGQTVIGVVGGWAELITVEDPRPTEIGLRLIPREGPVEPGGYVTIIYSGPVQVRASALDGSITPGMRLTLGDDGGVRTLKTVEVEGVQLAESAPVVGIALSAPDENGLVWVLLNPQ